MNPYLIFDIECDGFDPTRIHCLCYTYPDGKDWISGTITDMSEIEPLFKQFKRIVGHNIVIFDNPVLSKLAGYSVDYKDCIDTLALSWWLYPDRNLHGLAAWGEDFGIPKPVVEQDEWIVLTDDEEKELAATGSPELMQRRDERLAKIVHRCEEDVKINKQVFLTQLKKVKNLYGTDGDSVKRMFEYSAFKMHCIKLQEETPFVLDVAYTDRVLNRMEVLIAERREVLVSVMPKVEVLAKKSPPKVMYKKDGELSSHGAKWFDLLLTQGLPETFNDEVVYVKGYAEPNPNSSKQLKLWLNSLGWEPETYKYVKEEFGGTRAIPQINKGGSLCDSIIKLSHNHPAINELTGYSILNSRAAMLRGFLRDSVETDGGPTTITASAHGFTNTLRMRHKTLVNLPGVTGKNDYSDGQFIRGCLVADEGYELVGSDVSGLESATADSYIYPYDPEYVKAKRVEGYDPHMAIALVAKIVTQEDFDFYKSEGAEDQDPKRYKKIANNRHIAKTVNFSSIYGIGEKALAKSLDISEKAAKKMLNAYWKLNWAVKKFASDQTYKQVEGGLWVLNPMNKFWYSLRYEKDIFSTVNQSSGVYVFDTWLQNILDIDPSGYIAQFHDEFVLTKKLGTRDECDKLIGDAMDKLNKKLNLNVEVGFESKYGRSYADVH